MFIIDNDTNTMSIIRKDTGSFQLALDNYSLGDGDKATFTVAKELEQETPVIQVVLESFVDGVATFFLTSAMTDIEVGQYVYDVQINTKDGRVDTIIGPSKFKVLGGVTY